MKSFLLTVSAQFRLHSDFAVDCPTVVAVLARRLVEGEGEGDNVGRCHGHSGLGTEYSSESDSGDC